MATTKRQVDYDTPNKSRARQRGLRRVLKRKGNYLTLASVEGFCALHIWGKNPDHTIHNIERDPAVLVEWKKRGLPSDDYLGTLSGFIRTRKFRRTEYRLLNLDIMGSACATLQRDLKLINGRRNAEYITLTTIKGFRAGRVFTAWAKKKFGADADHTKDCIESALKDYDLVDEWDYKRKAGKSYPMRMFVFKRKERS